MFNLKAE